VLFRFASVCFVLAWFCCLAPLFFPYPLLHPTGSGAVAPIYTYIHPNPPTPTPIPPTSCAVFSTSPSSPLPPPPPPPPNAPVSGWRRDQPETALHSAQKTWRGEARGWARLGRAQTVCVCVGGGGMGWGKVGGWWWRARCEKGERAAGLARAPVLFSRSFASLHLPLHTPPFNFTDRHSLHARTLMHARTHTIRHP
jgi:hypothetical protein